MGTISTIRADIVTALQTIPSLQVVYDFPADDISGYPAAIVQSFGVPTNRFSDTERNKTTYKFTIEIYQAVNQNTGLEKARLRLDDVLDDVISYFQGQPQFAGSVLTLPPVILAAPMLADRPAPVVTATVLVQLTYLVSRT